MKLSKTILLILIFLFISFGAQAQTPVSEPNAWHMAGANPQRTSHVDFTAQNQTEIPGALRPEWYIPIEPYIHPKFQIIAANDTIFMSTAKGLYAFDAATGSQKWVYPTELPLGNSPTIYYGVAYVGGYDHNIHAVDITNGQALWTYEAGAGFETNPLIVNNTLYAGNRDGYMYALDVTEPNNTTKNRLKWRFKTDGPILYSAAAKPDNSTIYFASNDSYGYALRATDGNLIWKSPKLPGAGFYSWWPVYYHHPTEGDYVIFSGQWNERAGRPGIGTRVSEYNDLYPNQANYPGTTALMPTTAAPVPGDWASDTPTFDASQPNGWTTAVTEYLEEPTATESATDPAGQNRHNHKSWRRLYLVLNPDTGQEVSYDFDQDGQKEYAPITAAGNTYGGNRFPPVIGSDNVPYQVVNSNGYHDNSIPSGTMVGWKINTPYLSKTNYGVGGVDQPLAFSSGGKRMYWSHATDATAGSFDVTTHNGYTDLYYFAWNDNYALSHFAPDYNQGYTPSPSDDELSACCGDVYLDAFGGLNGVYGKHGLQNPPIPYKGKVYLHRGNSIIAFSATATTAIKLPIATIASATNNTPQLTKQDLQAKLEAEIQNAIAAGHLKPGFYNNGAVGSIISAFDSLLEYFHDPFETIYTLLRVRPLMQNNPTLLASLDSYIQSEWTNYNPATVNHIGWQDGAWREDFLVMPEVQADLVNIPKSDRRVDPNNRDHTWDFNPMAWYAMWMYAQTYGNASTIFASGLNSAPLMDSFLRIMPTNNPAITDTQLAEHAWAYNGYLAGLIGFSNLYDLAVSQGMAPIAGNIPGRNYTIQQIKDRKDQLLTLRAQNFTKDTPYPKGTAASWNDTPPRALNPSRNFIFMVPELADYLRTNALTKVQDTVDQYERITPYWFVSKFDATYQEGVFQPFYDYHSLLQARAKILKQPYEQLVKYLDVPAFQRGDLFYIDNLVSALEAISNNPAILIGDVNQDTQVNVLDIQACVNHVLGIAVPGNRPDVNGDGSVDVLDVQNIVNIILGV